jgi:hypothetical protein
MARVYASLPLTGPMSHAGRDVLRGAQLALEGRPEVELVALDSFAAPASERDSVLGRYSLDAAGHTTNAAYGVLAVEAGKPVWDV